MEFRIIVDIPQSDIKIGHQSKILMLGSCFTTNIGQKFQENKFDVNLNPFGVLYNPLSIKKGLELLISDKEFTEEDIFLDKGLYNSFYHHSSFSSADKGLFLSNINQSLNNASQRLKEADILFVTFGTSYVYEYQETKEVVGNCHKLPASDFRRYRLSVERIVSEWSRLLEKLEEINHNIKIIFTVSPIRHLRDGAHDNQLSKSTLLLAVDRLISLHSQISYFPSYEIVLDELRDYRFYETDMCHPSSLAIDYIWSRIKSTYFTEVTEAIISEWLQIKQAINHKPFNPDGNEYKHFLKQTLLKLIRFQGKYPFVCVNSEIQLLDTKINS